MTTPFPAKDFSRFHHQSAFLGGAVDIFSKKSPSSTMIYKPLFTALEQFFTKLQRASPLFADFLANCEFGVIANKEPHAFAWRASDKYYIGVTSGFVHLLFETTFASLCDNDCFSWIEDNYENAKSVKISKRALQNYFLHETPKAIAYIHSHLPDNPFRANIAGSLFSNAIIFTAMHEVGHCLMGHLDPSHLQTPDLISEVIDPFRRSDNEALRFFREYQADNISMLATLEYLMSERERLDGATAERFILWSISIDIVFWLLSKGPIVPLKSNHSSSHPYPQLRLAYKAFSGLTRSFCVRMKLLKRDGVGRCGGLSFIGSFTNTRG